MSKRTTSEATRAKLRAAPTRLNAMCAAKMIKLLQDDQASVHDLAELSGLAVKTARRFALAMHKEKAIHVVDWETDSIGRYTTKVFKLGEGKDKKRPPPDVSLAERRRMRAGRKQQMVMQNALAGIAA